MSRPQAPNRSEPAAAEDTQYSAAVQGFQDSGDFARYCVQVVHSCGLQWTVWKAFAEVLQAYDALIAKQGPSLAAELAKRFPSFSTKSWLPGLTQIFTGDICEHRLRDLQVFLDTVLGDPELAVLPQVQTLLGVVPPEPPSGLRVVPRDGTFELEVKPGLDGLGNFGASTGAPIDGYIIDLEHLDTGTSHRLTREVGASGLKLQRARIGRLRPGRHSFNVCAFNRAGKSPLVTVIVDTAAVAPRPLPSEPTANAEAATPCGQLGLASASVPVPSSETAEPSETEEPMAAAAAAFTPTPIFDQSAVHVLPHPYSAGHDLQRPQGYAVSSGREVQVPQFGAEQLAALARATQHREPAGYGLPYVPVNPALAAAALCARRHQGAPPGPPAAHAAAPARPLAAASQAAEPAPVDDDERLCVVCLAAPKSHAFVPCGHRCTCGSCARGLLKAAGRGAASCPICRTTVREAIQIFT